MSKKENIINGKVDAMEWITSNNGYPEVGIFEDKKWLQKFYKQLDVSILEDWCQVEGLVFTPNDNEQIHRMRVCMAILYFHYPKEPSTKKKAKYADYTMEALMTLCLDNDIAVEFTDSEQIMRMRTIMALRAAGKIQ
jgi:hypothetical protein